MNGTSAATVRRTRLVTDVLVTVLLVSCSQAGSAEGTEGAFAARGDVLYHNYLAKPRKLSDGSTFKPVVSERHGFEVLVSNSCWFMRITPEKPTVFQYKEAGFDGTNLFFLARHTVSHGSNPAVSGANIATASIYDNQRVYYEHWGHEIGPIWLMLASGHYLAHGDKNAVEPATILGLFEIQEYYKKPFTQKAYWSVQNDFPYLPTYMAYLDDGEIKTDPEFLPYKRKPPFDAGFTNVSYHVAEFGTFTGVRVPKVGLLDTYRPDPKQKSILAHYTQYRVEVSDWRRLHGPHSFRPIMPGLTVLNDERDFARFGHRTSLKTNWPTL